ncbi:hypothetical protein MW871_15905 [Flavobacterium sp. I-SCBP12n]|uniref:TIGR04255 family protein n=1 Tax=Flavobacterium pygoscelis TaxID=2893176 RepID=A0A9X1XVA4_9FLAO|nr:hypothetical protein [Flavobacterium pygoscelis]MCK8143376.1 hypothetical protein [Flavobacterium pygoscelis]
MNTTNIKYQLVAFGNYDEVTPSAENMKFFLENFSDKGLIPSQMQQINLNVSNNNLKNESVSRLVLTTQDKSWNVRFNDERIDINLSNVKYSSDDFISVDDFIKEAFIILDKVNSKFSKNHKRIGFTIQTVISNVVSVDLFKKFNSPLDYFSHENPTQWSNKFAFRKIMDINGKQEIVNITSDFSWLKGRIGVNKDAQAFEGLVVNVDINSLNENLDSRFNIDDIKEFTNKAKNIQEEISAELFDKIK